MGSITALAIAGTAASVGSSLLSSSAASSAADTQAAAANQASDRALAQFQQTRSDLAPFRAAGGNALSRLSDILGLSTPNPLTTTAPGAQPSGPGGLPAGFQIVQTTTPNFDNLGGASYEPGPVNLVDASGRVLQSFPNGTSPDSIRALFPAVGGTSQPAAPSAPAGNPLTVPSLTFAPTQAQLEATPGYQFIKGQGLQSVANSNAAAGRGISGAALKGAAEFATGLAGTTLDQQQRIFQANLHNLIDPLEFTANLGQNSAVQTGAQGVTATGNANALTVGGANALASGQVGSANALSSGLSSIGGAPLNYLLYTRLLGGGGGGGGGGFDPFAGNTMG